MVGIEKDYLRKHEPINHLSMLHVHDLKKMYQALIELEPPI